MTEIVTNEQGGKQSKIDSKMTEVPPIGLLEVAKVMSEGLEVYPREANGTPNWHKIDCCSNLDHGIEHIANFLAERNKANRSKNLMREELSHAAARLLMALEQFIRE